MVSFTCVFVSEQNNVPAILSNSYSAVLLFGYQSIKIQKHLKTTTNNQWITSCINAYFKILKAEIATVRHNRIGGSKQRSSYKGSHVLFVA